MVIKINIDTPENIFSYVSREVDDILESINSPSEDEQVSRAKHESRSILEEINCEVNKSIKSLDKHTEWDRFTIAFYGETNAGKSTIIETLRIMLKEQSKVEAQNKYKVLQSRCGANEEKIKKLKHAIVKAEEEIIGLQKELIDVTRNYDEKEEFLRKMTQEMQPLVADKKEMGCFWKSINIKKSLKANEAKRNSDIKSIEKLQREAYKIKSDAEHEYKILENNVKDLESLADGAIIGNGRSDFTLENKSYTFKTGNQKFTLIDVPGIEGKENKVIGNIWSSVQKAHAVFYVTGKAAAPQKGDEHSKGTLEKIKEHLGSQTEVWTIFNKRITNPMQLGKSALVSKDEQDSLNDLDAKMVNELGESYQKHIVLSAQPAFLAVAECLVENSSNAKNKIKFLNKLSSRELMSETNFQDFHDLLVGDFVKDYKYKIVRSNFNKANQLVKAAVASITKIRLGSIKPLEDQLRKDSVAASAQMNIALSSLKSRLESQGERAINDFKNSARKDVYKIIDSGVSNDFFKDSLKKTIKKRHKVLERELPSVMDSELGKFVSETQEVVERFRRFANESFDVFGKLKSSRLDSDFELKINIDSGLKVHSLLASLVGGALLFWNPAGWIVLAPALAGLVFAVYKSVRGFFSTKYKMAQQRKSVDENLSIISDKMRNSLRDSLHAAFPELEDKVKTIEKLLEEPVFQVSEINRILAGSAVNLTNLSSRIEKEVGYK